MRPARLNLRGDNSRRFLRRRLTKICLSSSALVANTAPPQDYQETRSRSFTRSLSTVVTPLDPNSRLRGQAGTDTSDSPMHSVAFRRFVLTVFVNLVLHDGILATLDNGALSAKYIVRPQCLGRIGISCAQ